MTTGVRAVRDVLAMDADPGLFDRVRMGIGEGGAAIEIVSPRWWDVVRWWAWLRAPLRVTTGAPAGRTRRWRARAL